MLINSNYESWELFCELFRFPTQVSFGTNAKFDDLVDVFVDLCVSTRRSDKPVVSLLHVLLLAIIMSNASLQDKGYFIFRLFDFNANGYLESDELSVISASISRLFVKIGVLVRNSLIFFLSKVEWKDRLFITK